MADHGRQVKSNEELLREHFAGAERRDDWPRSMAGYEENVVLLAAGDGAVPNPGVFFGRENVGRWFAEWLVTFDDIVFDIEIVPGRDALAVHARHSARGKESGAEVAVDLYYAYWFRAGKVIRVEVHAEQEPAWRAAGVDG